MIIKQRFIPETIVKPEEYSEIPGRIQLDLIFITVFIEIQ